jgi:adenylate cyclase
MVSIENAPSAMAARWPQLHRRLSRRFRNNVVRAIVAAHLIAAAIIGCRDAGWLQRAELFSYDLLRVGWAGAGPSSRITLIGASEDDITSGDGKDGRRWGWPLRDGKLAALLERLAGWRPRVIGVDIYRDLPEPPGTDQLDAVLRRHPEIVWVFKLGEDARPGIPPPQVLRGSDRAVLADTLTDGTILRRGLLFADDGVNQHSGLGLALALAYLAPEHVALEPASGDDLRLGKALISPLDSTRGPYFNMDSRGYQILLDYRGGPQPFPLFNLSDVMDRDDLAASVRDRIVIVGVSAESVKDSFATPFTVAGAEPVNGIAIHAHLADQLIREAIDGDRVLNGLPRLSESVWVWAWALVGAALGLTVRSTLPGLAAGAAAIALIGAMVYVAFGQSLWLPAVPAMLALAACTMVTNQLLHASSNRARARLRRSFEHYLPPAVISRMIDADVLPSLGGERREISVIFTDVAGFTGFAEGRDPEEVATITNAYFDGVCAAVFKHGGLVNSFQGDGVLAFFGAPQAQADHADRAIGAALEIEKFADKFQAEQRARGVDFGHTRIGVHSGLAFVGNVGARDRLQYTAQGDVLNTASRLEGLNKATGTRIAVSGDTAARCRACPLRPLGSFIVKGRHEPTEVFTPVDPQRHDADWIARYNLAFGQLKAQSPEASEQFRTLHREDPEDACVAFHYNRLAGGETGALIEMHEK